MSPPQAEQRNHLILLASAHSYRVDAFVQAAHHLDITVIHGVDMPPPLVRRRSAYLAVDYRDLPKSVRLIQEYAHTHPIGGILGLDDSGSVLAAMASAALDLPYNDPAAARAARDKYLMRQAFAAAGVPSPSFARFSLAQSPEDVARDIAAGNVSSDDAAAGSNSVSFPCVLKPLVLSGSQGVIRADNEHDFCQRWKELRAILIDAGCQDYLVENYIPGIEVAVEGLLDRGTFHMLALFDKPDPLVGPYFEETIYVTPSRLPAGVQQQISQAAAEAAAALGLRNGPVHAELRVNETGAWLVELASRSIGGLCSQTLRFADLQTQQAESLETLILRQLFQRPFRDRPLVDTASGVMMIPIPKAGILRRVTGVDAARSVPLIEEVTITAAEHYLLTPLPVGNSYLGFIFARGPTPAAVETALRTAHALLQFTIEEPLRIL